MKKILNKLFEHEHLSRAEAYETLTEMTRGGANEAQVAAFMTVYLMRTISVEELEGFRAALLDLCVRVELGHAETIDLCGTGGDGKNTFNISTLAGFVVAGAGGKVVKHGNYGVSSVCGSSNVLESLGYRFKNEVDSLRRELDRTGICFLHAPLFHPALKSVGPVRKALGVKTFFNMLGPLVNPASPSCQFTGVFSFELQRLYGYLLQRTRQRFRVVHTFDGYDELSMTAPARVVRENGEDTVYPAQLGGAVEPADLAGGETVEANRRIFTDILTGKGTPARQRVVVANAAMALQCLSPEKSTAECLAAAEESLASGRAEAVLHRLIDMQ
ncbi:MAG: anthranilate phosphoribosyltransferase [Bacteroidota bacterium]|jgi:anthranilate phosphoribosyltransferase